MNTLEKNQSRIEYLDLLRVLACFMVLFIHAGDPFLFDGTTNTFNPYTSFLVAFLRPSVPLFIMISAVLLLPIKQTRTEFIKRRFKRVGIPFLVWSILYVFLPIPSKIIFGGPTNLFTDSGMNVYLYNLMMIPINFTGSNVHFWFIYTILGLYLTMPILSPWIKQAELSDIKYFLILWVITLFFPYIKIWFPQILGECDWNDFGMLFYFGGYLGYVILAYYLHHHNKMSFKKSFSIGIIAFAIGLAFTYQGFLYDCNRFLEALHQGNEDWKILELCIGNLTPNVVLMTVGVYLMFQKLSLSNNASKWVTTLSKRSYGIFLVHYILNLWIAPIIASNLSINEGIEQLLVTLIVFTIANVIVWLLSYIPKSRYIIG
ncbi:acyltransferase [Halosquirtibacter laminarini]|uniref:Acyltransferase n=1 Tax=Halosquirtibacter laminarini TaxID=3374600 RepID=A0AC61NKT4_9BACT|nr:acyltransferase [Prolixibacteraceae bacterium]